ncbi:MAG: 3-isopropylmalate dehydratase large subunit [Candidatus Omnitrophica bacterium]|nr:3-isopropylmalate dehydratase large subunit [Candidatus Omnitrophota bacterium]
MTLTEKILARAAHRKSVEPGDNIWVDVDVLMTHDICGPGAVNVFYQKFGRDAKVWDPDKLVIIPDHFIFTKDQRSHENINQVRTFAREQGVKYFYDTGEGFDGTWATMSNGYKGVCHIALAQEGHNRPGEVLFGTDSHTCTSGAFGEFATGIGDADAALIMGIGKLWVKVPPTMKFVVHGKLPTYLMAKDLILYIIGDIGIGGATYQAMEFAGEAVQQLSVEEKMTLCNMVIEAGGKNGVIEPNEEVLAYVHERTSQPFQVVKSDADAKYRVVKEYDAAKIDPVVAKPHSPDNRDFAKNLGGVKINRAYIGSCTGGKITDFRAAAKVLQGQRVSVETFIVPATREIYDQLHSEQVNGRTLAQLFKDAGCIGPEPPGCQACLGGPVDTIGRANKDEVVISSTNRNFTGRMGSKQAQIYLASPYTVMASAIRGRITDPREFLG